jgi:hypothetical protein
MDENYLIAALNSGQLLSEERLEDGYDPNGEPQLESRPLISSGH